MQVKVAEMIRTPRYDVSYSSAQLDKMQKELEKLSEREASLLQEQRDIRSDAGFTKLREAKALELRASKDELLKELTDVKHRLSLARADGGNKLIDGADVMKLAGELRALREREALLTDALDIITSAMSTVSNV